MGTEHRVSVLDLPDTELRIPAFQDAESGFTLRLAASGRSTRPQASSLIWHGLTAIGSRHVKSYESNFEHSSAPNAVLTSARQGEKADSHPKEEGGPLHEENELRSEKARRTATGNAHRAQTLSKHTRTCNTVAHVYM